MFEFVFSIVKKGFFPKINNSLIQKFKSYDNELGWCNQKNNIKIEISQGKKIQYSYNHLGSRSIGEFDKNKSKISTFGDSYCLAREVDNLETWQYFLSKRLNSNVSNFGVGNYGLDQALLRLKREFKNIKVNTVIMAVTPYTITRITSVWKHFSEFNNVLATKPRYINLNNELKLVPNFIQKKENLLNIINYKKELYKNDEHIKFFKKHIYTFPFIFSFLSRPRPLIKTFLSKIINIFNRLKFKKIAKFLALEFFKDEILYRKKLYKKHKNLLQLIIKDFIDFSEKNNFTPILLILPVIEDLNYIKKTKDYYYKNYFNVNNSKLINWDFSNELLNEKIIGDFFVDDIFGGHYNKRGNIKLSKFIEKKLNEISI